MGSFFSFGVFFLLCFSLQGQNDDLQSETIDETNPLYFPIDSGFVFFVAEEGKIIFAHEETSDYSMADSLIDLEKSEGRLAIAVGGDTTYYIYKLVDVNRMFNSKRGGNYVPKRFYRSTLIQDRIIHYDHVRYNSVDLIYRQNLRDIAVSFRARQSYFGRYQQSPNELVDYQFSVFESKFAFYTTNSSSIMVFDKFGNVEAFSILNPTEPFIYSRKQQSIYYDEVQQEFYLLNISNFSYNWYEVNPDTGDTKLLQQIKKQGKDPSWWVLDGTLHYTITEDNTTSIYDVPLH